MKITFQKVFDSKILIPSGTVEVGVKCQSRFIMAAYWYNVSHSGTKFNLKVLLSNRWIIFLVGFPLKIPTIRQ